jgi:hypothetical protein
MYAIGSAFAVARDDKRRTIAIAGIVLDWPMIIPSTIAGV